MGQPFAMRIRQLKPQILAAVILLIPVNQIVMNYLFSIGFFRPLSEATDHFIQPTLVSNLISLTVFSFVIFRWGRLDLSSVMVTKQKLGTGLKWGFVAWLIGQAMVAANAYVGGEVTLDKHLNIKTGRLIGQLFGNAALEELLYRGLFILQFYLIFNTKMSHRKAVILSVVLSQLIFAVIHIPNRLLVHKTDDLLADQIRLFVMGVLFAIMFIRTANLPFLIIVHSLVNEPFDLTGPYRSMSWFILLVAIVMTVGWPKLTGTEPRQFWPDGG